MVMWLYPPNKMKFLVMGSLVMKGLGSLLFHSGCSLGACLLLLHQVVLTPILYDFYNYDAGKMNLLNSLSSSHSASETTISRLFEHLSCFRMNPKVLQPYLKSFYNQGRMKLYWHFRLHFDGNEQQAFMLKAKFSATVDLGVIHKGHLQQGRSLMAHYFPQDGAGGGGSPYSDGGGLYALALIHANHGDYIFDEIKNAIYTDMAVAREATGITMGLLMVGAVTEKRVVIGDCPHSLWKRRRSRLIERMTRDQDPIIHYVGMYALSLAYRGTKYNKAIRQLMHFAVSDVNDDVRRTVVLALRFVLVL